MDKEHYYRCMEEVNRENSRKIKELELKLERITTMLIDIADPIKAIALINKLNKTPIE